MSEPDRRTEYDQETAEIPVRRSGLAERNGWDEFPLIREPRG